MSATAGREDVMGGDDVCPSAIYVSIGVGLPVAVATRKLFASV